MKKIITKTNVITLNQQKLSSLLNLPLNAIRFLREENVLQSKKVGVSYVFDWKSVNEFKCIFNRDNYLTVGECKKKLEDLEFYTYRGNCNQYISKLGIYITVKKLINGGDDIPNEYRLEAVRFGTTKYISTASFYKTLNWLISVDNKVNPKWEEDIQLTPITVLRLSNIRNIRNKSSYRVVLKSSVLG